MHPLQSIVPALQGAGLLVVLLGLNLHLFTGSIPGTFIYSQHEVLAGEWWRIITHPFVHVSWYHLLLDTSAVVILWQMLSSRSPLQRLLAASTCSILSLVFALLFSPYISQTGYCGLSGVAHGLVTLFALSCCSAPKRDALQSAVGLILFLAIAAKSGLEVHHRRVIFTSLHLGELGQPIVHAHLGGVVGGMVSWLFFPDLLQKPALPRRWANLTCRTRRAK